MALNVDKEIAWVSTEILPEILKNGRLVDNYSDSQLRTFKIENIKISIIGSEEAYMMTQCYRATIKFEYAGQHEMRKMVVKKTPEISPEAYYDAQFDDLFYNEIVFYTEVLPIIQNLSKGNFAAPRYYHSEVKPNFALLILEDFAERGWTITKDRFGLSLEHARIAVKYLGRFHGLGYAIKHNQKELFEELTAKFRESRYAKELLSLEWDLTPKVGLKRVAVATETYHPEVDKDFVKKVQQLVFSYCGYGRQRVAPREPFSTLCHGDYLRNNVAYKYDTDSSGKPVEIMMFDYQTMRICSPMIDLSIFLALSLFADVRAKHFDSIFDDYCNALCDSYAEHTDQSIPDFLSRQSLLKEYIQFLPYSISISVSFLMWLVDPPENSDTFNDQITEEQIIKKTMTLGGDTVDREIAHQMKEMFELSRLHNVQIDEHFDTKEWINSAIKFFNS